MNVIITPRFERAYKKFVRGNPALQSGIERAITLLALDVHSPALSVHRLKGNLAGLRACSCGYDCRIVFSIESNPVSQESEIVLLDIGTHDEVY